MTDFFCVLDDFVLDDFSEPNDFQADDEDDFVFDFDEIDDTSKH